MVPTVAIMMIKFYFLRRNALYDYAKITESNIHIILHHILQKIHLLHIYFLGFATLWCEIQSSHLL